MKKPFTYPGKANIAKKLPWIIAPLLMILSCTHLTAGYSPIAGVDNWDATRLKEAGITITSWKHERIGEDPPLDWVRISYDTSKLPRNSDVLMTLHVVADDGKIVSAYRAERKKGDPDNMTILFVAHKNYLDNSSLQILALVPESFQDAANPANPGFGGYSLGLSRIMELAQKAIDNKKAEQEASTGQPATRPESKSEGNDKPQPESEGRSQ